jgi:uncharacterized protein (TIGR03790 family)
LTLLSRSSLFADSTLASVRAISCCALAAAIASAAVAQGAPPGARTGGAARLSLPAVGLRARDIAVVVNDADPASVEVGRYYAEQRGIAPGHVIHVRFPAGKGVMSFADFERVQAVLDDSAGVDVQAYALAWTQPFGVECMSVTAAFAFGFDPAAYCPGNDGCQPTKVSPYFNSRSNAPFTDYKVRPAMLLAGDNVEDVKRLIDRGLRSDESWPDGKAYLVNTSDRGRNVRAETYARVRAALGAAYPIEQVDADALEGKADVMFEFTGIARVASIASNTYLDGAIADHLTSFGGVMPGAGQTSALEWLTAGATGSYGTTTEPCNFRAKFPDPGVAMAHYLERRDADRGVLEERADAGPGRLHRRSAGAPVRRHAGRPLSQRRGRGEDARAAAGQLCRRGRGEQHRTVPSDRRPARKRLRRPRDQAARQRQAIRSPAQLAASAGQAR